MPVACATQGTSQALAEGIGDVEDALGTGAAEFVHQGVATNGFVRVRIVIVAVQAGIQADHAGPQGCAAPSAATP